MTFNKKLGIAVLLASFHLPALAADCVVKSRIGLNLRSKANFSSNVLLSVDPGRTVKCDPSNIRNGLIKVTYRGTEGWMSADPKHLTRTSAEPAATVATEGFAQSSTGRHVNVRRNPNGALVDSLKGDKRFPIIPSKSTSSWYAVLLPDGSTGYVYKELTAFISGKDAPNPAPVKTEEEVASGGAIVETQTGPVEIAGTTVHLDGNGTRVNVRSGAGTGHAIVETLSDGFEVTQTGAAAEGWVPVSWLDGSGQKQSGFVAERLIGSDDGTEAGDPECDREDGSCGQAGTTPTKLPDSDAKQCMIDRLIASAKRLYGGARPKNQCAQGVRLSLDDAGFYNQNTLSNWDFYGHDSKSGSSNQARLIGHGLDQLGFVKVPGVDSPSEASPGDILVFGTPVKGQTGCAGSAGNKAGHTEIKISENRYISDGDNSVARNGMPWRCRPLIAVYRVNECKRCTQKAVNACHL